MLFQLNNSSDTDKIRITYIINSLQIGGAEVGMCRLLNELDSAKYLVTVVALDSYSDELVTQIPSWVRTIDLRVRSGVGTKTVQELYSAIRSADVIVGSLFYSSVLVRSAKLINRNALIVTWHHADQFKSSPRRLIYKWTSWISDAVLADSEPVADMLISDLGLDRDLVYTVPIAGIDLDQYTSAVHDDTDEVTVGTVGRLSEQKNYSTVLDIAERSGESNIRFEIAGDGELYEELQAEIEERNLTNVTLHGLVDDVPSFLGDLDIYLQPSRWEGLCITVLEAMAAGLPVVGSDVGGIGRNVEQGTSGYLCSSNDVDGFVSAIETLAEDPEHRRRFGERGREIVKNGFTRKVLVREFKSAIGTSQD